MTPVISFIVIAALSLLVVRIGANALVLTGLSSDIAGFQACSAFFGVGFTTRESELIVSHPVRRRIVRDLIITGNLGLTAGLGSVIVAFVRADSVYRELQVAAWMISALVVLWLLAITPPVQRLIDFFIRLTLRRSGVVHALDYALLLRVHAGFAVSEVDVRSDHALAGTTLADSRLHEHGIVVLGVIRHAGERDETYIGAPHGSTRIEGGDVLIVYGREREVRELFK